MGVTELRVLGPIEVAGEDGAVPIGAHKLRTLLSALVIRHPGVADLDFLIDALWGETPPASAPKLIQVYVSQLRRVLVAGFPIRTSASGYVLEVPGDAIDAVRFERLAAEGRAAAGNPALAASLLGRGLGLWRGPAYADVRYEPFATAEADRLESLRQLARLDRYAAELELGRQGTILPELRADFATDETDERLARMTMLALYREGAVGDALQVFDRVRAALRSELGEEPGSELVRLRDAIQRRDPHLLATAAATSRAEGSTLPVPANRLIGRDRELAELRALLERPDVRLLSLTGAGGSGKSRLAAELARLVEADFANGVAWTELASLTDPELVLPTIARVLDLDPGQDAYATLVEALQGRELLLIVDNFEHVRGAAPSVVRLLSAAPHLRVVTTTRAVLHVSGEHVYPVAPLTEHAATALFVERALAADAALRITPDVMVSDICRRLDHLPLAIELAAARVRALGVSGVRDRLAKRLTLLSGGPRDVPARQQTLRETLTWSVNLLQHETADVLAALAVFPSGCTLEAAVAVAGADDAAITELVDHSLLHPHDVDGQRRYRLLETVREHAYESLGDRRAGVEAALVGWVRALVREADFNVTGRGISIEHMDLAEREIDTIRDALRHAASDPDPTAELELTTGLWRFWWVRGYVAEGLAALEDLLVRRGHVRTRDGARAVRAAASLAWTIDDTERARDLGLQALDAAVEVGDPFEEGSALNLLGAIANSEGRAADAVELLTRGLGVAEAHGLSTGALKLNLGLSQLALGAVDAARQIFQDLLELRLREGNGPSEGMGFARINLGETELLAGNLDEAEVHYRAAAESFAHIGFHSRHANALQGLAAVEVRTGRWEAAARHLGMAAGLLHATGWGREGSAPAVEAEAAAREALGDESFEQIFAAGRAEAAASRPDGP